MGVQEKTVSIASSIKNAYIDFSKMTVSVIAISTDVIRDGKSVIGYGFNSNGRYAQSSLLRDRFIPRLMQAETDAILTWKGRRENEGGSVGFRRIPAFLKSEAGCYVNIRWASSNFLGMETP